MHLLAIHAHPDDCEILAGGTLYLLASAGHQLTIVSMTPGDGGSHEQGPEEIADIRRKEAEASAKMLGAQYRCAEFRDLNIFNDDPSRRRVTELLREIRPDVVLTASPVDYHCDHEATSVLVRDGCFAASAPNYKTGGDAQPLDRIPSLYFMDSVGGLDREQQPLTPHFVVDVTDVFDQKKELLHQHASQRSWLKYQHGVDDYVETMERWTRHIGHQGGFEFGEGFRRYRGLPYPQTAVLENMFAEAFFLV